MRIISLLFMITGWVIIFRHTDDKFLSSVGGFLLMMGAAINWR